MSVRSRVGTVLVATAVLVAAALVVGQLLGQPLLLSYVETGSMGPTMEAGDGYVAVPAAVAGPVEEGDVIVFRAEQLHGGGLTTHRVVEVTDQGYVTQGDANPFTDQDGSEPHVTDGQVVAKAWQTDGGVVVIPNLGTAVETVNGGASAVQQRVAAATGIRALFEVQWMTLLLFGVGVVALVAGAATDGRPTRSRDRSRSRPGVYDRTTVVAAVALVVFVAAGGAMVANGGTAEYGIVSAEFDSDAENVVPAGETRERTVTQRNGGLLPVYAVTEPASPGVDVEPRHRRIGPRDEATGTLRLTAPPETGYYVRSVTEYHYVAVLPRSLVLAAHSVHPWLAILAVATALSSGAAGALWFALGTETIRTRETRGRRTKSRR